MTMNEWEDYLQGNNHVEMRWRLDLLSGLETSAFERKCKCIHSVVSILRDNMPINQWANHLHPFATLNIYTKVP